jgi:hypothetical protein
MHIKVRGLEKFFMVTFSIIFKYIKPCFLEGLEPTTFLSTSRSISTVPQTLLYLSSYLMALYTF